MSTRIEPSAPEPSGIEPSGPSTPDQHGAAHSDGVDGGFGRPEAMVTAAVHAEHKPTSYYIMVALILAGLTALETSTYWIDFGPFFMPALLIMMTIKFFMVVLLFMHLKFDNRLFGVLFYAGLFLAVFVYIAALATFQFFGS
jgi:cytochrome c oxidase subunit 4